MSIKITEALLAEHVVFHNLFDTVERALPDMRTLREAHALATVLSAMLEAHSKVEDELIIEPLDHCFEQLGQHDTFHQEHEEIDASLDQCLKCRNLRKAREFLRSAVVGSRQHFPHLGIAGKRSARRLSGNRYRRSLAWGGTSVVLGNRASSDGRESLSLRVG
jgi:hypothetical protein